MGNCVIHPIPLFEGMRYKSHWLYLINSGQQVNTVQYIWFIEGTKETILVDAGSSSEHAAKLGYSYKAVQTIDAGLGKLGLSPGDIDLVILTHLHYDHVAQASQFPKARFLIQKDELAFAQNPHPVFASAYPEAFFDGLNFEVIDGDTRVCQEVSVLKTPGHTPGGQSVSIKTAGGIVIISGLCTIRENFEPVNSTTPVITPGIHTNALDAYDSVLRIKQMADIVVPIHDPEYLRKSSIP